jgi:hypothetical protein
MWYPFTPSVFNQFALNQFSSPNLVVGGPQASSFNGMPLSFQVERNPHFAYPWAMPQGSLIFPNNVPPFQEGRRNSMPDSFQSGRADQIMVNFDVEPAMQRNRRASLFSSVRETAYDISDESNFPPIEEIKRFFNINPETNQVETPKSSEA